MRTGNDAAIQCHQCWRDAEEVRLRWLWLAPVGAVVVGVEHVVAAEARIKKMKSSQVQLRALVQVRAPVQVRAIQV